jgi:2-polyprenyl-3-methyl-5-hydroxy-6-metoxy-1,4-benzoquinol methylase
MSGPAEDAIEHAPGLLAVERGHSSELDCLALYEDAAFYDAEFAGRDHEIPFYLHWSAKIGAPILEVACGSGRLTLPIAEQGLEVVGLDLSAPMLARARDKSAARGRAVEWLH